ncbi:MORC family CW-type zinc finger protein 3-like isoform X2 [Oscarella lobularis]|uniref:MORC family CW-type zinc finger protein 3-like isoform X2 n=1 Tax=Oscarella lobularis TaxID=121494 RepID=UPI003313B14D
MFERSPQQLDGRPEYRGVVCRPCSFVISQGIAYMCADIRNCQCSLRRIATYQQQAGFCRSSSKLEYRFLLKAMNEHLVQYWRDVNIRDLTDFWNHFGYSQSKPWTDQASNESRYVKYRRSKVKIEMQCDLCLKWRKIPFSIRHFNFIFTDDWTCSLSWDLSSNSCSKPEKEAAIRTVRLTKATPAESRRSGAVSAQPPAPGRSFSLTTNVAGASRKRGFSADDHTDSGNVFSNFITPLPMANSSIKSIHRGTSGTKAGVHSGVGSSIRPPKKQKALRILDDNDSDDIDDDNAPQARHLKNTEMRAKEAEKRAEDSERRAKATAEKMKETARKLKETERGRKKLRRWQKKQRSN